MKFSTRSSQGFTLIELIVVIVILGIMAAIAGPKFIDLQTEARLSVMSGVEGAVRSTATLVYSKSLIEGEESIDEASAPAVDVAGGTVTTHFGYPNAENTGLIAGMDLEGDIVVTHPDENTTVFTYSSLTNCNVTYVESASDGAAPTITTTTTDC
ncbi:prepilin-type N-terminal cleavage/methylation domain-containing protein [Aliikangiella sp. G2MR2-5]|uniref:prepilin-type N-terminal cleavage/methylation domain-containing protein n=1 Tax=Aliikangiella sp. G2MR2-5 TaxID=2788943 RepID=UPI0018AB2DE2